MSPQPRPQGGRDDRLSPKGAPLTISCVHSYLSEACVRCCQVRREDDLAATCRSCWARGEPVRPSAVTAQVGQPRGGGHQEPRVSREDLSVGTGWASPHAHLLWGPRCLGSNVPSTRISPGDPPGGGDPVSLCKHRRAPVASCQQAAQPVGRTVTDGHCADGQGCVGWTPRQEAGDRAANIRRGGLTAGTANRDWLQMARFADPETEWGTHRTLLSQPGGCGPAACSPLLGARLCRAHPQRPSLGSALEW